MDGYTFTLKSRLRPLIFQVNKNPIRSGPFCVKSRLSIFTKSPLLFVVAGFFIVVSAPLLVMASLLLKEGAKYFITTYKLITGMMKLLAAPASSKPLACRVYKVFQPVAN